MRLMLKYREVAGLGDAAQALLDYSRQTRALEALLHEPSRAGMLVVALDEPLVRGESARLVRATRELRVDVIGVLWNRSGQGRPAPLPVSPAPGQFLAPARNPAPVGVAALRAWTSEWRELSPVDTG